MSTANSGSTRNDAGLRLLRIPVCGLFLVAGAAASADTALAQCAAIADASTRLACYDTLAGRSADAPVAAPARPAEAPAPPAAPGDFGLPKKVPSGERPRITARIAGPLKEWKPGTLFKLDNGQVWKAVGDDAGYYPGIPDDAEVTITQSFFGGYWLEIAAIGRKVRVKRVS